MTTARLFQQREDGELAAAILGFLQQQAVLPEPLERPLAVLLEDGGSTQAPPIFSQAQGLAAVINHLAPLLD